MTLCKINISDRQYKNWELVEGGTLKKIDLKLKKHPQDYKLMNQDIFTYEGDVLCLKHSSTRSMKCIPGVLVLEGNKMYGKVKKNRYYYRVVPDDRRLPEFLMAYSPKIGFEKKQKNKYIVFKFKEWTGKHPICSNVQTIGDIGVLENFYEYQLYCKSLYASIQDFTKKTIRELKLKSEESYIEDIKTRYNVEDRSNWSVITIDPTLSKDFDDGLSIMDKGDSVLLSIYISNVSFWMDAMGLWGSFTNRIATIYLPDRKRPMLPTVLSDALCSLQENRFRFAITLDILVDKKTNEIKETSIVNSCIKVKKNLRYDTEEQENDEDYKKIFEVVKKMNKKYKYVDQIDNSHDIVAYTMILMNYIVAKKFMEKETGIFRTAKLKDFETPENVPEEVKKFLKMWNSFGGKYVKYDQVSRHEMLKLDAYVHITSPIRRLVDLLNIIELQDVLDLCSLTMGASKFYKRWTNKEKFEYINITMRSIRKVQNDCALLNICVTDKSVIDKEHDGFIFDKIKRNDDLYQYMVYFPEMKMVNRFTSRYDKVNLSKQKFKLFIFIDEIRLREKIRIEVID